MFAQGTGQNTEIEEFVVPHICEPLTKQPLIECAGHFSHLAGLKLADDSANEMPEIDMLIGSDFYWHFVTGESIFW